jgi:hypothetical protein
MRSVATKSLPAPDDHGVVGVSSDGPTIRLANDDHAGWAS